MTDAIATRTTYTREQVDLIKRTFAQGSTDDEFRLFVQTCERLGLDPFARQAFLVKRWNTELGCNVAQTQVSIDGFRVVAERTGRYEGQVGPQWCGEDGAWRDVWLDKAPPAAARVGVFRAGHREPIYGIARYASFVQTKKGGEPNRMWATMPDIMLAKCAESQALRKAFPQVLSGIYSPDEMGQSERDGMVDGEYVTERAEAQARVKNESDRHANMLIDDVLPTLQERADVERFCHFNGWDIARLHTNAKSRLWRTLQKRMAEINADIPAHELRQLISTAPQPEETEE